jgi:hypothetical protein
MVEPVLGYGSTSERIVCRDCLGISLDIPSKVRKEKITVAEEKQKESFQ